MLYYNRKIEKWHDINFIYYLMTVAAYMTTFWHQPV